jgi:Ras-related protein Rab-2A
MSGGVAVNFDYLFKYIIIGDAAVGKSNLLLRYTHGQFKPEYQLTIGVEFGAKNISINNKTYRIQIWDTAGQENFRSITRAYYKNSACALVVYDISSRESFDNVSTWIEDCRNQSPQTIFMVLVGNKTDLDSENKRVVSFEEGQELAEKNKMMFFETSAKSGKNVDEIFYRSAESIAKRIEENFYDLENESCGIKTGIMKKKQEVNIDSGNFMDKSNNNNRKKDCC